MRRRRPNTNREWRASHLPGLRWPSWANLKDDDPSLVSPFFTFASLLDPAAPHTRKRPYNSTAPTTQGFDTARETEEHVYHLVLMPAAPGPRFGCTSEES